MTEIKDYDGELDYIPQLQAQMSYCKKEGLSYRLIVNMGTTVTPRLLRAVRELGGTIQRYSKATGDVIPY
jgi:hypothetical protein